MLCDILILVQGYAIRQTLASVQQSMYCNITQTVLTNQSTKLMKIVSDEWRHAQISFHILNFH